MNQFSNNLIIFLSLILFFFSNFPLNAAEVRTDFILDWSTDTYIPPDYPGKALSGLNSLIKVVAEPASKLKINPNLLRYDWFLNDRVIPSSSGIGKTSFYFSPVSSYTDNYKAGVRISDQNGNFIFKKNISIKIVKPEVILRSANLSETPGNLYLGSNQTVDLLALPYFFNIKKLSDLDFNWQIDESAAETSQNQNVLSLKIKQIKESLTRILSVSVTNKNDSTEKNSANLNIFLNPF